MKTIRETNGRYAVCKEGYVYSLYAITNKREKPKKLKPKIINSGYFWLPLASSNRKGGLVHRLVVEAYIRKLNKKEEVNHKNGNKLDNRLCNLEICTTKENTTHAMKLGLRCDKGSNNPQSKLTKEDVLFIRKREHPAKFYEQKYNIHRGHVYSLWGRRRWKHI